MRNLPFYDIEYTKLSGRKYKLEQITFSYLRLLDLDTTNMANASKALLNDTDVNQKGGSLRITALNALISQHVSSRRMNDVVPVGPNKFFLKGGYKQFPMLDIHRGYFTSIRPGFNTVLLNVNVAAAAFYQPMYVSDFFRLAETKKWSDYGSPRDLLKGLTVRIAYRRESHDNEYDPNIEEHRHRVIAGFGESPSQQETEISGKSCTVAEYFARIGANIPTQSSGRVSASMLRQG